MRDVGGEERPGLAFGISTGREGGGGSLDKLLGLVDADDRYGFLNSSVSPIFGFGREKGGMHLPEA